MLRRRRRDPRRPVGLATLIALLWFVSVATAQSGRFDTHEIQRVLDRADYTFYNKLMYTAGQEWIGKTVTFRGTIAQRPVIIPDKRDYIQVSGQNSNNDPVNVVGYLDTPMRSESDYEQRGPTVSRGQNVIVFGILGKPRDFVDEGGYVRFLPTMDVLLIYAAEDRDYRMPIWVSRSLRR
jgi:hypothetical protein